MKKTGIWLDKEQAHIVNLNDKNETFKTIASNIEHYNIHGGSGTKFKGGPQDVVQDSKYLEREKHQFKSYFKRIVDEVKDSDALVILGPAETNQRFAKALQKNNSSLARLIKAVEKTDSMTDNQIKAWVKNFFLSN